MRINSNISTSRFWPFILLAAGGVTYALTSAKWVHPFYAWLWPALLLCYTRLFTVRKKYLLLAATLFAAQYTAATGVVPAPWPVVVILSLINVGAMLLVFYIDAIVTKQNHHFLSTLAFPLLFTAKETIDAAGAGGSWWAIANSQFTFGWFAQLSAVTGIAGISFMVYWFGSVICWLLPGQPSRRQWRNGLLFFAGLLAVILTFGYYRNQVKATGPTVKIAGIAVPNTLLLQALHQDAYHTGITINPRITPGSAEMQKINTALAGFIEAPSHYTNALTAAVQMQDSLFTLSKQAALNGAQVIVWPEAAALLPRAMNDDFISRGREFAANNKVFLLLTMGVFDTGVITPTKMFLENKAILIGPAGDILNIFHKNFPVPFAERSTPGNGDIPVIQTRYGRLAVSICYDADMPGNMQQLSKKKADILLLPSGDWYNIDPFHSYMAAFRGIENGCAVFRQVSGGLSLATDSYGGVINSFDYFTPAPKIWYANMPVNRADTLYAKGGAWFGKICLAASVLLVVLLLLKALTRKFKTLRHKKIKRTLPATAAATI